MTNVVDCRPSLPVPFNVSGVPICDPADVVASTSVNIEVAPSTAVLVGTLVPSAGDNTVELPITVLAPVDGVAEDERDVPATFAVVEAIMGILKLDTLLIVFVEEAVAGGEISTMSRDQYRLETIMLVYLPLNVTPVFSSIMEPEEVLEVEEILASVAAIKAPYQSMHVEARGRHSLALGGSVVAGLVTRGVEDVELGSVPLDVSEAGPSVNADGVFERVDEILVAVTADPLEVKVRVSRAMSEIPDGAKADVEGREGVP